jgi:hypothetical protein
MPDLPHMMLAAGPPLSATLAFGERYTGTLTLSNNGTQPLRVTASVPPLEWVVDAAGVSGTPLYDLSAAPAIALADDTVYEQPLELGFSLPVYGQLVSRVYLSSNGWISVQPSTSAAPLASCVDGSGLPPGSLAAFWTDLDPSAGGTVRAAAVDADTFVVSFEDVPHWKMEPDPAAPTYTFQIVLHAGGAVDFVYGAMGELPARWAAGASLSSARSQSLFCFKSPAELSNRRWTLHNQPSAATWLSAASEVLVVLPGQTTQFPVVLKGFGFVPWLTEPFVGSVRLSTNDPSQAAVNLPAQAIVGPPVATFWFPVMRH